MKAIIFDLDGTLVNSYPGIRESLNFTRKHFGLPPLSLDEVKRIVGHGVLNLIRTAIGEEHSREALAIFREHYESAHVPGTILLPEVRATLQKLSERGIKMAVASNKPQEYSLSILQHLEIDQYILACFGPEQVEKTKPHPAMLQALMKLMDVQPAETLYVGDMVLDVQTARNAGVPLALIATGGNSEEELRQAQPDYLLKNFSDLLSL